MFCDLPYSLACKSQEDRSSVGLLHLCIQHQEHDLAHNRLFIIIYWMTNNNNKYIYFSLFFI